MCKNPTVDIKAFINLKIISVEGANFVISRGYWISRIMFYFKYSFLCLTMWIYWTTDMGHHTMQNIFTPIKMAGHQRWMVSQSGHGIAKEGWMTCVNLFGWTIMWLGLNIGKRLVLSQHFLKNMRITVIWHWKKHNFFSTSLFHSLCIRDFAVRACDILYGVSDMNEPHCIQMKPFMDQAYNVRHSR